MKVLTLDIETSPHLVYRWAPLWKPEASNLDMLVKPSRMLCVAAKWLDGKMMFRDERDPSMVEWVRDLLDEADVVVHYNGIRFDVPRINNEIATRRLIKPSPFKHVDLSQIVQRTFDFPSGKLAYVAPTLTGSEKEKTGGFGLWTGVMADDAKAWKKMRSYNEQDVRTTEALFIELRNHGWLAGKLPHPALTDNDVAFDACPTCGGEHTQRRGYYLTGQSRFPKFQCQQCGTYFKGSRAEKTVKFRGVS
jgi:DNA polymerase elongation subunit (family B)